MLINLLCDTKLITSLKKSIACVISIIINVPAVSCTPKQIDLQLLQLPYCVSMILLEADVNQQLHNVNAVIIWGLNKVF